MREGKKGMLLKTAMPHTKNCCAGFSKGAAPKSIDGR
jgi:hypothetical protein